MNVQKGGAGGGGNGDHDDDDSERDIPIVAALPAPLSGDEGDECIRVYPCHHLMMMDGSDGDNDLVGGESEGAATTASASAESLDHNIHRTPPPPPSMTVSSIRLENSSTTTGGVSTFDNNNDTVVQSQNSNAEPTQPITTTATPSEAADYSPSSPSISAIATPEPIMRTTERQQQGVVTNYNNDNREATEPTQQQQRPASSSMIIATPDPPIWNTPQRQQQGAQLVAPLEMDQLASPAPSMVVTDEQCAQTPTSFGKWRTTLCSCWCDRDVICSSLPWMACCCPAILIGQIMTRLRLNWGGHEDHESYVRTFGIFVSITFGYVLSCALGVGMFVAPFFLLWLWIMASRVRGIIRYRYEIPARYCCPTSCHGVMEDLCCSIWCLCCSTIVNARQTHNEKRYPYECFSPTGLPTYAPTVPASPNHHNNDTTTCIIERGGC